MQLLSDRTRHQRPHRAAGPCCLTAKRSLTAACSSAIILLTQRRRLQMRRGNTRSLPASPRR